MDGFMKKSLLYVFLCLASASASAVPVSSKDFGDKWPFKISAGKLECVINNLVVFYVDDKKYGINGFATSMGYQKPDEIIKDDPKMLEFAKSIAVEQGKTLSEVQSIMGVAKMSISPILDKGLALCGKS